MNMARSTLEYILICANLWYLLSGCKPSYPANSVAKAITQICKDEYGLSPDVRILDGTLSLHLAIDDLVESSDAVKTGFSKKTNQKINNIISVVHRVILSTDKKLDFYVIIITDKEIPDIEFVLIRNVEDVLKANANAISITEFFKRGIMDLRIADQETGHNFLLEGPIVFEKFLAFQMAKRIKEDAMLQTDGGFENGRFIFILNDDSIEAGAQIEAHFIKALSEIVNVLKGYRFTNYGSIYIMHKPAKKLIDIPKQKIQMVIDKKLTLQSLVAELL